MNVNTGLCAISVVRVGTFGETNCRCERADSLERRGHGASYSVEHEVSTAGAQVDISD